MYSDDEQNNLPPSKSQRKREAQALQQLGAKLAKLSPNQLETIPLPADLKEAVAGAQLMTQRGAHKRQLLYIGKRLRQIDPTPIQQALATLEHESAADKARHRQLEHLCAALIDGDQDRLQTVVQAHPEADRQHIRQLVRNAAREQQQNKPPASRRALFRYLRQLKEP